MILRILIASMLLVGSLQAIPAYVHAFSLKTQVPLNGEATPIWFDTIGPMKNVAINEQKNQVVIQTSGVYLVTIVLQAGAVDQVSGGVIDIWLVKNGTPIPNSGNRTIINRGSGVELSTMIALVSCETNDNLSVYYAVTAPSMGLIFLQPDRQPAVPSVQLVLIKVDESVT